LHTGRNRVISVLLLAVVAASGAGGWSLRSLRVARAGGATVTVGSQPVGRTVNVGVLSSGHVGSADSIRIEDAQAAGGSSDAEVEFALCLLGQLGGDLNRQLTTSITPRSPGVVRIKTTTVTYSVGWQRGTQRTGPDMVVPAR